MASINALVSPSAQHDRELRGNLRPLEIVHVDCRSRVDVQATIAHIANNSDDVQQTEIAIHVAELDLLSDRIAVGSILPHERLADECCVRRVGPVGF
jgi:hypothetical protein